MLPEFSTEPRELPWQLKFLSCHGNPSYARINQNSANFSSVKCYGDNVCMYSKVFGVGEFKYANRNYRGAKGVAIATKCTQKGQKYTDFSYVRNAVPIYTHMIGFRGCRIQTCCLNFSGNKENCYGNQIGKNKPKLQKFHFCIKY